MSNLLVLIIAILAFFLAYRFYASFISKVVGINDKNITPAHKRYDGLDYIPARNWLVLFGHHFSSIAGAGPIVGPILVCIWWGWVPAILWAILGSIFIGGVHDFLSLAISSKEEGNSIGKISETFISKSAGIIFLIFVWFALLLVVAVFALVCAKTFTEEPRIILPSLGIIPVALLIGVLLYRFTMPLSLATVSVLSVLAL
ncbi:MAG TPA: carbon starvation protein A, partial [Candidatus Omnitrophica bacterium]|nr:carbon starvation protein A [Candidatus Omnitrophota bacterium]